MTFCLVLLLLDFKNEVKCLENVTDINLTVSESYLIDINDSSQVTTSLTSFDTDNTSNEYNFTEVSNTSLVGNDDIETTTIKADFWIDLTTPNYDSNLPCTCDLLSNSCDVNCCCDNTCSDADRRTFTECGMPLFQPDDRYCYSEYFVFVNNTQYTVVKNSKNLFCIYTDNFLDRLRYSEVPVSSSSLKKIVMTATLRRL